MYSRKSHVNKVEFGVMCFNTKSTQGRPMEEA
jgi:hypothetical protein